jgi:tetratricopeptide (TPR) repeat protein
MAEKVENDENLGEHPHPGLLERFMRGDVLGAEKRQVVRHLLAGCPRCVAVTRRIWNFAGGRPLLPHSPISPTLPIFTADAEPIPPATLASYDRALAQALAAGQRREAEMAAERAAAPGLLAKLLQLPWERRLALVRRNERYQTVALADLLLDPHTTPTPAPSAAALRIERAELAAAIAERLDPADCGPTVVRDLLGRAWVQAGEARRLAGDLPGAERAWRSASPLLAEASPGERLDLLCLQAAIVADRGRFDEADRLLDHAALACRSAGELQKAARAAIERGTLHATAGRYESAIELLGAGTDLLAAPDAPADETPLDCEPQPDPALLAAALHRRAELLFEVGRGGEAREVAVRLGPLYERLGDRTGLLRLGWLRGKIEEDGTALLEVREGLLAAGLGLAAAQVSLDLAVVYARKGRWGEIRHLAEEMLPIFRTRDLRRESMAGLLVFRRAVETESASVEFLVEVARYLLGSRRTRWGSS